MAYFGWTIRFGIELGSEGAFGLLAYYSSSNTLPLSAFRYMFVLVISMCNGFVPLHFLSVRL